MSQVSGSTRPRWSGLTRAVALLVLGALCGLTVRRRTRQARQTGTGSKAQRRAPVHVTLPADGQRHDGRSSTQRQLVFLEGGPADGSRVALHWKAVRHQVTDADRGTCTYLDSGRTRPDALGQPARVFVAQ